MSARATPWTRRDGSAGLDILLDSVPNAAETARRHLGALSDLLPASTFHDLRTVVTELVDNSVLHGTGGPIALEVGVTPGGVVRGTVSDGGRGPVEIAAPRNVRDSGLGLRIVDVLVSRWGVNAPSSDVWFELAPLPEEPDGDRLLTNP
jgi:anti-sigma regulatory factor (Ser/Thr protein kinase)